MDVKNEKQQAAPDGFTYFFDKIVSCLEQGLVKAEIDSWEITEFKIENLDDVEDAELVLKYFRCSYCFKVPVTLRCCDGCKKAVYCESCFDIMRCQEPELFKCLNEKCSQTKFGLMEYPTNVFREIIQKLKTSHCCDPLENP